MKRLLIIMACIMLLCTACAEKESVTSETASPAPTQKAEATPMPTRPSPATPTPSPQDKEEEPYVYTDYEATDKMLQDALIHEGNSDRIIAAMQRAQNGEDIYIGVIGGSITYGASAAINKTYAKLVYRWWKKKFPESKVKLVNAGKSGTGSIIGAHRVQNDLLYKEPDFVIVEFAVNDLEEQIVYEAYENLVRSILTSEKQPGVMLLMMCADGGYNSEEDKIKTGLHYDLPMISYKTSVYKAVEDGELAWDDVADDFIHPGDLGHHLIADLIIYRLEDLYQEMDKAVEITMELPDPRTKAYYTHADLMTNETLDVTSLGGFETDDHANWVLPLGWKAISSHDPMEFEVEAKTVILAYNQTINDKGANVEVKIDGDHYGIITSKSPYTWEAITSLEIIRTNDVEHHTVSLELLDELPDGCTGEEFYLLAVLVSK